jgi:hypothetical protein
MSIRSEGNTKLTLDYLEKIASSKTPSTITFHEDFAPKPYNDKERPFDDNEGMFYITLNGTGIEFVWGGDGYRSYVTDQRFCAPGDIASKATLHEYSGRLFNLDKYSIDHTLVDGGEYYRSFDGWAFLADDGETVIMLGTDNTDDYYPGHVCTCAVGVKAWKKIEKEFGGNEQV